MSTRALVEASWRGAQRAANAEQSLKGTAPTVAGQYLAAAEGDTHEALKMLPDNGGRFWSRVRTLLTEIEREENAARAPLLTGT